MIKIDIRPDRLPDGKELPLPIDTQHNNSKREKCVAVNISKGSTSPIDPTQLYEDPNKEDYIYGTIYNLNSKQLMASIQLR